MNKTWSLDHPVNKPRVLIDEIDVKSSFANSELVNPKKIELIFIIFASIINETSDPKIFKKLYTIKLFSLKK